MYGFNIPNIVRDVRETIARETFDQVGLVAKEINLVVRSFEFPDRSARAKVN